MTSGERVLVLVDDDPQIRETYSAAIRYCRWSVVVYESYQDAVAGITSPSFHPHFLLTDFNLSSPNEQETGLEVARVTRSTHRHLPIWLATSAPEFFDTVARRELAEAGVNLFGGKPRLAALKAILGAADLLTETLRGDRNPKSLAFLKDTPGVEILTTRQRKLG